MALYMFRVTETRHCDLEYAVEADSLSEAIELAEDGVTTMEVELGDETVLSRDIQEVL